MREQRLEAIRRIVETGNVGTQRQLRSALAADRLEVDQSTLSRDLRELGVRKTGGRYVLPSATDLASPSAAPAVEQAVTAFRPCGPNLIVVRTLVGQAQPVALFIDAQQDAATVGSVAGDDTIFLATKSTKTQAVALRRLQYWFGDRRER